MLRGRTPRLRALGLGAAALALLPAGLAGLLALELAPVRVLAGLLAVMGLVLLLGAPVAAGLTRSPRAPGDPVQRGPPRSSSSASSSAMASRSLGRPAARLAWIRRASPRHWHSMPKMRMRDEWGRRLS